MPTPISDLPKVNLHNIDMCFLLLKKKRQDFHWFAADLKLCMQNGIVLVGAELVLALVRELSVTPTISTFHRVM